MGYYHHPLSGETYVWLKEHEDYLISQKHIPYKVSTKVCDDYEQAPKIFLSQKIKLFNFGNHAKRVKFNNEAFWKLAQYMIVLIDSILFFASLKNISLK